MKKIFDLLQKYREIISYLFWGVMTTCVSWGSYSLFARGMGISIAVSNVLSWICAMTFAYITNKIFVFHSYVWKMDFLAKEFGLFASARLGTGILEIIFVPLLVHFGLDQEILGVKGAVSKVLVSFLVVVLNYVFSKLFIFKDSTSGNA